MIVFGSSGGVFRPTLCCILAASRPGIIRRPAVHGGLCCRSGSARGRSHPREQFLGGSLAMARRAAIAQDLLVTRDEKAKFIMDLTKPQFERTGAVGRAYGETQTAVPALQGSVAPAKMGARF